MKTEAVHYAETSINLSRTTRRLFTSNVSCASDSDSDLLLPARIVMPQCIDITVLARSCDNRMRISRRVETLPLRSVVAQKKVKKKGEVVPMLN
jgi:hypothetical protein